MGKSTSCTKGPVEATIAALMHLGWRPSAPDVWEAFYEVEPLSLRPPDAPAPDAPVPGAAGPHAAGPVAPAPGATTHGAAPDAPAASSAEPGPHVLWLLPAEIVKYQ